MCQLSGPGRRLLGTIILLLLLKAGDGPVTCHRPRRERKKDKDEIKEEGMYVYIMSEPNLWTVGFYNPDGQWHAESDWPSAEDAANRVCFLNGGERLGNNDGREPVLKH
jgi:hypothetical protein